MSRSPWLGRPTGRHAAGARGRTAGSAPAKATPPEEAPAKESPARQTPSSLGPPADAHLFCAPTMADAPAVGAAATPPVSPVTDAARAAAAATAASLPTFVPPGAAPLVTIDALGRKCPIPIIMLAAQIRDVPVGSVIAVLADDPAAYSDIPAWCGLKSHDCVFRADCATGWSFGVRRRY
jgi:tRNA 2-thiouridine synthesizing protein A